MHARPTFSYNYKCIRLVRLKTESAKYYRMISRYIGDIIWITIPIFLLILNIKE